MAHFPQRLPTRIAVGAVRLSPHRLPETTLRAPQGSDPSFSDFGYVFVPSNVAPLTPLSQRVHGRKMVQMEKSSFYDNDLVQVV